MLNSAGSLKEGKKIYRELQRIYNSIKEKRQIPAQEVANNPHQRQLSKALGTISDTDVC